MAREAGFETLITKGKIHGFDRDGDYTEELKAFEALVRADEREQGQKWFDAVTAQHKQEILAEREACAKVADYYASGMDRNYSEIIADDIRARGNT
jgi:bisphosphoglycerate-independent phosphoglycerate mutase (AlkP superfamily)